MNEIPLDELFDKIDDWLLEGRFDECSSFLASVLPDDLTTAELLTILTATLPAHAELPSRPEFFARVESTLQRRGEAESLVGLEGP